MKSHDPWWMRNECCHKWSRYTSGRKWSWTITDGKNVVVKVRAAPGLRDTIRIQLEETLSATIAMEEAAVPRRSSKLRRCWWPQPWNSDTSLSESDCSVRSRTRALVSSVTVAVLGAHGTLLQQKQTHCPRSQHYKRNQLCRNPRAAVCFDVRAAPDLRDTILTQKEEKRCQLRKRLNRAFGPR